MRRALNLSDDEIVRAGALLTESLRELERTLAARPVVPRLDRDELERLLHQPFPEEPRGIDALFEEIADTVIPNSTAVAHPRFLAYVLGPPNGIAPFADALASALNQNCNFSQLSPAASVIEQSVVGWLGSLFDMPSGTTGLLTSGGSIATQTALTAAIHNRHDGDFRQEGLQGRSRPLVLYTSDQAHGCVTKAAATLGLGLQHVRRMPTDSRFRMRTDALRRAIDDDRRAGRQPFCVVATAGTVATGAIDPLPELVHLCATQELWLHVDGAFGALFVLSDILADLLRPCGQADSLALDPHKLLFAPLEAGCLMVRDGETLRRAFGFRAAYLGDSEDPLLPNFMDLGPQLSRDFKAFKVWCALRTFGVRAFREAIGRLLELAQYMGERIDAEPDLNMMAPVGLNAVCFRHAALDDLGNERLLRALTASGMALLGPVSLHGRFGLRCCVTNHRTTRADIDAVLDELLRLAAPGPRPGGGPR